MEEEEAHKGIVATFQEVTDCVDATFAASFLEAHGWDLERSVEAFLTGDASAAPTGSTPGPREKTGVQAETDSDVRAPIPAIRDTLLDAGAGFGGVPLSGFNPRTPRTVFDAFRDYRREEAIQKQKEKIDVESIIKKRPVAEQSKLRTLANIFRPPLEVLFAGSFEHAKRQGSSQKKWLLVNIQEFASSQLNRDTWSKPELKELIANSFLMIQTSKDSEEGKRYSLLYKLAEYPHIGLLDPRTGQLLHSWSGYVDAATLLDRLGSFVSSHSLDDLSATTLPRDSKPSSRMGKQKAKVDLTEEEMLAEAIAASLSEPHGGVETASETKKRKVYQIDDDDDDDDDGDEEEEKHQDTDGEDEEECRPSGERTVSGTKKKRPKTEHMPSTSQGKDTTQQLAIAKPDGEGETPAGTECTLQIRAMDGSTFSATFREEDTLDRVRRWLIGNARLGGSSSFALVSPFPRRTFGKDDLGLTLKCLGLTPRAVLILHPTSTTTTTPS